MRDYHYFISYQASYQEPDPENRASMRMQGYFGNTEAPLSRRITTLEDVRSLEEFFKGLFAEIKPDAKDINITIIGYQLLRAKKPLTADFQRDIVETQISKMLD